jgi:phosphoribosylformimino-5-aminoimidazole carboxamide ribotide isomerase
MRSLDPRGLCSKKVYSSDPLEIAKAFEGAGIQRLHVVDLDGAKAKKNRECRGIRAHCERNEITCRFWGRGTIRRNGRF